MMVVLGCYCYRSQRAKTNIPTRNNRNVKSVMGWELKRQLKEPGAGCVESIVEEYETTDKSTKQLWWRMKSSYRKAHPIHLHKPHLITWSPLQALGFSLGNQNYNPREFILSSSVNSC